MVNEFEMLPVRERIIVALDCGIEEALALADALEGRATWLKVGMTLYYAEGPHIVEQLKKRGFKVFLDLKFNDIPHQIEGAAAAAVACGADMLTMHASGGLAMMQAALRGVESVLVESAKTKEYAPTPVTLGITVLTSMSEDDLLSIGVEAKVQDQVLRLAKLAQAAGISGVVASPQEASLLRSALGSRAYIVTPGVRPAGASVDDQSRVATPEAALSSGASHVVIGRPITQATNPVQTFEDIAEAIGKAQGEAFG